MGEEWERVRHGQMVRTRICVFVCTPGSNSGHLGQVCTLCTFSYQICILPSIHVLIISRVKKMSKCHIVTSYLMTSQKRGMQIF